MQQISLSYAVVAGEAGMARAADAAERRDPAFRTKAEMAVLAHLAAAPSRCASGEDLVDAAIVAGACAPDARAFGSVFLSLSKRGLIRCVRSDLPRRRGHGTSGGKLWSLC
jgi:hypothetical protein